ncbi:MAG: hypothetical protein OCC49_00915 [Fibrobacterales bacterium]
MKQSIFSMVIFSIACIFWHCSVSETSGTASGAENAIAGVLYNPDTTVAVGVPISLRQATDQPDENTLVYFDTTDTYGEFSFNQGISEGIFVATYTYESKVVGTRTMVIPGDSDVVILLQPTYDATIVIPENIDSAVVWVAGDSSVTPVGAGDTLYIQSLPIGVKTLYLQHDSVVTTETVTIVETSSSSVNRVSSADVQNYHGSSSSIDIVLPEPDVSSQSNAIPVITTDTVPVHPIDTAHPIHLQWSDTIDVAINHPSYPLTSFMFKEEQEFKHLVWEQLDSSVYFIRNDTVIYKDYGIGTLRAVDTVTWREGIFYIRVEKYFDPRLNVHGGVHTYESVMIDTLRIMKTNMAVNTDSGSSCYEDDEGLCSLYGKLYDWEAAKDICPVGWRLPWNSEWRAIGEYITAQETLNRAYSDIWLVGPQLMDTLKLWWDESGDTIEVSGDHYGFSAFPAGYYDETTEEYKELHTSGTFWGIDDSDIEERTTIAWALRSNSKNFSRSAIQPLRSYDMDTGETIVVEYPDISKNRYSVRCVLDR